MPPQRCIFCDVPLEASHLDLPSSRTKEHVFAVWFRALTRSHTLKMFTAVPGSPPVLARKPPFKTLVNTAVCQHCNSGWMSDLELAVSPLFDRLLKGEDVAGLSEIEIAVLAKWAGKTVAVLSYVTAEPSRVPKQACMSLHPNFQGIPRMRVFYCTLQSSRRLDGGFLQLVSWFGAWSGRYIRSSGNEDDPVHLWPLPYRRFPPGDRGVVL